MDMSLEVRRADHIIWAAAGEYNFAPEFRAFDRSGAADFYWNFILGAARRYFDMDLINDFLKLCQHQFEGELFINLTWIGLEHAIYEKAQADWPNLSQMRQEFAQGYVRDLDITQLVDYFDLIKLAYFEEVLGKSAQVTSIQKQLLRELKIPKEADTATAIQILKQIFKTYFYRNLKVGRSRSFARVRPLHLPGGKPGMAIRLFMRRTGLLKTQVVTGIVPEAVFHEKTGGRFHFLSQTTPLEEIQSQFGQSLLSRQATEQLETDQCTGRHEGLHIHLGGAGPSGKDGEGGHQAKINLEYYGQSRQRNRMIIARLTQNIARILERDSEIETVKSSQGSLLAGQCWRGVYLKDDRIFGKQLYHDQFDLSFDILVDASASQLKRQSEIAQATYILAKAFTNNNIAVRVLTYKSIREYLVLNILKGYQVKSCEGIFSYYASGFNRDGLAVRTTLGLMEESHHRQKYLIVITDGNPSDIVGIKNTKRLGRTMDYAGRAAVLDLAQEVTKGKSQGIKIVGLLIGRDENLDSFETVFGHNRLHLKDPMEMTDSLLRALRQ